MQEPAPLRARASSAGVRIVESRDPHDVPERLPDQHSPRRFVRITRSLPRLRSRLLSIAREPPSLRLLSPPLSSLHRYSSSPPTPSTMLASGALMCGSLSYNVNTYSLYSCLALYLREYIVFTEGLKPLLSEHSATDPTAPHTDPRRPPSPRSSVISSSPCFSGFVTAEPTAERRAIASQ